MKIISFRSYEKNTLKGFFAVMLSNGLEIRDLCLFEKNGKSWIRFPSKPYRDKDNNEKWSYIINFPDKEIAGDFQKKTLSALADFRKTEGNIG